MDFKYVCAVQKRGEVQVKQPVLLHRAMAKSSEVELPALYTSFELLFSMTLISPSYGERLGFA